MQSVFKVSSSNLTETRAPPRAVGPGLPPPHPPCLPKSATPSACTWTTWCELTESGTPILWRTRTSRPGRHCATTGVSSTCRRTLTEPSLRPRLGRESQSQPSSCSPSPIPVTSGMSESTDYMDAHTHTYSTTIFLYGLIHVKIKVNTVPLWGDVMWDNIHIIHLPLGTDSK